MKQTKKKQSDFAQARARRRKVHGAIVFRAVETGVHPLTAAKAAEWFARMIGRWTV